MNSSDPKTVKITVKNCETIWSTLNVGDKITWSKSFGWKDIRWHSRRFGYQVSLLEWDNEGYYFVLEKVPENRQ